MARGALPSHASSLQHASQPLSRSLPQLEGQHHRLNHRYDFGSSMARRFRLRRRSRTSAVVLIAPSLTRTGPVASSLEVAQYRSMTVALDQMHRFVDAPKANRAVENDAPRAPLARAFHRER